MKKILLPGLIAGLAMLIVGIIVSQIFSAIFPSVMPEYQNTNLFRAWSDPIMNLYWLHPFVVGLILAWIWNMTKSLISESNVCKRGCTFGLIYWVVTIPGMLISYASFPISLLMIASWTVSVLAQALTAGYVLAVMNK